MKISFPHLGNVYIGGKSILEDYGHTVITPPPSTQKTLELGTRYAPESICLPFKIFLGNAIESIEKGADTFVITGSCGPCIFGFYSILLENILFKLGYDIHIILLDSISEGKMDLEFPILSLVVDEMTGEAGYQTRLEAFIDLINRRKGSKIG